MIILSANNLGKVYGTDVIIRNASFSVNAGDRIGIVGKNGAGKTTLLNMLTGELPHDEGEFFVSESTRIGYLKQRDNFFMKSTVYEEIDNIFEEIHDIEHRIEQITGEIDRKAALGQNMEEGTHDDDIERAEQHWHDQSGIVIGKDYQNAILCR